MAGMVPCRARPRIVLLLSGLLLLSGCLQIEIRDRVRYRWSTADSGLVLREGPGLEYARIGTIPFGARVRMVGIVSETTILAGHVGRWSKVVYQGLLGYSFDAFLADAPPGTAQPSPPRSPARTTEPPVPPALETAAPPPEARKHADEKTPEVRPVATKPAAPTATTFAYAVHDVPGLVKLSRDEFRETAGTLVAGFRNQKSAFQNVVPDRGDDESVEDYLRRSEKAKRRFLENLRRREQATASQVYSIYDALLELGPYRPGLGHFAWMGTSVPINGPGEIVTLPNMRAGRHRFVNGRKYDVKIPPAKAEEIREAREEILVRIDFSYTETLQDLFDWTLQGYFLPRYLMLYHRETGRIYYACKIFQQVETDGDPAAPLHISGRILDETVY